MRKSYRSEILKAGINFKLDLYTGTAFRKAELSLKLLVTGDFINGPEVFPLSESAKINVDLNNFDRMLVGISPAVSVNVPDNLSGGGSEQAVNLNF